MYMIFFLHLSDICVQNPVFYNNDYPAQKQIPETTGQFNWITMNADDSDLINKKASKAKATSHSSAIPKDLSSRSF